jgi:hypothetical protein
MDATPQKSAGNILRLSQTNISQRRVARFFCGFLPGRRDEIQANPVPDEINFGICHSPLKRIRQGLRRAWEAERNFGHGIK